MEENRPARGRARGRSRRVLPGQEPESMEIGGTETEPESTEPMDVGQRENLQSMYGSDEEKSGSGNGSGSDNGDKSPNGNGNGNGNGKLF